MRSCPVVALALFLAIDPARAADPTTTLTLWPGKPPGETKDLPPEAETTKPTDQKIAGKPVSRIGNVSTPTLAVFKPKKDLDTGTAVVICPGGGHSILAYDLEGTEVAEWLNSIGVTGIVLKYRVPARDPDKRYRAAVQDGQRAVSLVRSKTKEWGLDEKRIGVLGFSAGGETAVRTALATDRTYDPADDADKVSARPDFAVLVYPGSLLEKDGTKLREDVKVTKAAPPMFFAHAGDDRVSSENSVQMFLALKRAGVQADLHVYASGGHGFGLRPTEKPCTQWPKRCEEWMTTQGWLKKP
jgi:acetyl esterase/lipase